MDNNMNPFGTPASEDDNFEIDVVAIQEENLTPEGRHVGKCINIVKETSKAGNPMWTWTFVITEGPSAGKDFKLWTAITPAAIWKLVETLAAFGLKGEAGKPAKFGKADVLNVLVEMDIVRDEDNNGQPRSSLDKVLPYSKGVGMKHTGNTMPMPGM